MWVLYVLSFLLFSSSPSDNPVFENLLDKLLSQHAEAMGGYERWANLQTLYVRFNDGDGGILEAYTKRPSKFKLVMRFAGYEWIKAWDGQTGWARYNGEDKEMTAGEAREMAEEPYFFDELLLARDLGYDVRLLSREKVDHRLAYKIRVTKAPDDVVTYYLNAQTFLIDRIDETSHDPKWAGRTFTNILRDYQSWDGMKLPSRWCIHGADKPRCLMVEEVIVDAPMKDAAFSK
jgi:hypothetical protein